MKAVYLVLFNQFITVPFSMLFFWLSKYRGCPFTRELPTFHWVLYEIGMFALIEEFFFYYSHRYISIFFFLFSWKDGRWQLALVGMYTLSKIWPKEFGCSSFSFVLFSLTNFRLTWVFNVCPSNGRKCSSLFHTDTPSPARPYAHFVDRKT